MTDSAPKPKKKRKYWYYFYFSECELCGRSRSYKERRYGRKPPIQKRGEHGPQWACDDHFL